MTENNIQRIIVGVAIATYKRKAGLTALLDSLIAQDYDRQCYDVRVFVVDNDPNESARPICEDYQRQALAAGVSLTYLTQKQKGLSTTRNVGCQAAIDAGAQWIVTIDDDETASVSWLSTLFKTQSAYQADVVSGYRVFVLPEKTPWWVRRARLFAVTCHPTGHQVSTASSSNALFRREVFESGGGFDPDFQLTGGEDHHFFSRAARQGFKLVFSAEALAHETVSSDRLNFTWWALRAFRSGNTLKMVTCKLNPSWAGQIKSLVQALRIFAGCWVLMVAGLVTFNLPLVFRGLRSLLCSVGMLAATLGILYQEYR